MLFLVPRSSALIRTLFLSLILLAACAAPRPNAPPPSRNIAALQAAEIGALGEPALIEFYTTDCMSCRAIRNEIGFLDQRYDGMVKFIYLDADLGESKPYHAKFNVRGVPTIALLDRRGRVESNIVGWHGEQTITDALTALASQ
jgi:thioredoxin-like negative regulator of GroEL